MVASQRPSQYAGPVSYTARSPATAAAPASVHRIPDPLSRAPITLHPASVGPLPMSTPAARYAG